MKFSKNGYKNNSKDKNNPYNVIKSSKITMKGVSHPVMAVPYDKNGNPMEAKMMMPEEEYDFGGEVSYVMEIPYKNGGKMEYAQTGIQTGNQYPQDTAELYFSPETLQAMRGNLPKTQQPQIPLRPQQTPQPSLNDLYNNVGFSQHPQQREQVNPLFENLTLENLFGKGVQGTTDMVLTPEQQLQKSNEGVNQEIKDSIESFNKKNSNGIQQPQNQQFFNPYGGYDIPTAAYLLGENIQQGDTLGTVGSAAKVLTGLGRNLVSGLGNAKRNQFVLNEADEKRREAITGQTIYAQAGGELTDQQVQEVQQATGDIFTDESVRQLFMNPNENVTPTPNYEFNLGKFKDVPYYNVQNNSDNRFIITPSERNSRNAGEYKADLTYLQKLNPDLIIEGIANTQHYIPTDQRMQEGGEVDEEKAELLTGDYVTGNEGQDPENNVEVEDGEYMMFVNGDVSKVDGDKHKDGGEKMNVAAGTKVISAFTEIGKDNAKYFRDNYGIKLKAKNTYADVMDKISKDIGYDKLTEEEVELIEEIDKQKEVDNKTTNNLNLQFLSGKMQEIKEQKQSLTPQRQKAFQDIFERQEVNKPEENKGDEMQYGGEVNTIAKKYGMTPDRVNEILKKYQEGGMTKTTKEEAEENVRKGIWEDLGNGRYRKPGTDDVTFVIPEIVEGQPPTTTTETQKLQSYRNVWNSGKVDKSKYPTFEGFVNAAEEWWANNPDKRREQVTTTTTQGTEDKIVEQEEIIAGTPEEFFYVEQEVKKQQESMPENTNGEVKEGKQKVQGASNVLALPDQTPLPPSALQPQLKGEVRLGRLEPTYISPEASLTEIERQRQAAASQLSQLPDSQRQAVIANMLSNTQSAANKATMQSEIANQQAQMQADQFNIGQRAKEDLTNLELAAQYERNIQTGMSNYEQSLRNYFNAMQQNQLGKFNEIQRLNLINQKYDNFQYTPEGVQQTSSAEFSAPKLEKGGLIKRKIQDYLKGN